MNLPTQDQVFAFGRHIITAAASVIGTLATVKLVSGGDAQSLQTSLDHISHGFSEIVAAVAVMVTTVSGIYASLSANPVVQMLKGMLNLAKASPAQVKQIVADAPIEQKAAVVAAANAVPAVQGVPLSPTKEGQAIAALVPAPEVAVVRS